MTLKYEYLFSSVILLLSALLIEVLLLLYAVDSRYKELQRQVKTSGRYFREFKLSSLESKLSIETRESWRESRLSKFSKFIIRNIVK